MDAQLILAAPETISGNTFVEALALIGLVAGFIFQ